jgi:RNA polymerase sigma-70 factor (ECF subfamily)
MFAMEESDLATVSRARNGDSDAFRMLVERHSRSVFGLVYRMTGNAQDAEDLVQETFIKAFRNLKGFEDRAHFGSWLYRIAVNCFLDWKRRHRTHVELDGNIEPKIEQTALGFARHKANPDQLLLSMELQQRMEAGLAELSAKERAAFVLRHFEGMSIQEIGQLLDLDASAAKHSVYRAVQKMRRVLAPMMSQTG